ncbi:MAG: YesL family protein [Eubacterium sp.]|nr:YesL family protein [Eubacterium sp.]
MSLISYDSDFMGIISRIADLAWLNILCFIFCIPIVTSGAAVTAKYYTAMKLEKGEAPGVTRAFFHSFKQNFIQDLKITLILVLVYAFFAVDWYLVYKSDSMGYLVIGMLGIFTLMVGMTTFCIFPLIARFEMKTIEAFRNALVFGVAHFPRVLLGVFLAVIPYFIGIWYYKWAWLIWLFIYCMALYYNARFFIKKFDKLEEQAFGPKEEILTPEQKANMEGGYEELKPLRFDKPVEETEETVEETKEEISGEAEEE